MLLLHRDCLCALAVGMCLSNGGRREGYNDSFCSEGLMWRRCRPHRVAISSSYHLMTVVIVFALPVSCSFLADLIAFLLLLWRLFYLSWQHITHRKHMPLATLLGLVLLKQHRMAGSFQLSCDYSTIQTISVQYQPFQKGSCHNLFPAFLGGTFISMGVLN